MKSLIQIFQSLQNHASSDEETFLVSAIPKVNDHRIGISTDGFPLFFIKCNGDSNIRILDTNLELISIQYNRICLLKSGGKISKDIYTIISLKTDVIDLQQYFLEIIYLMIKGLSDKPKLPELKAEVEKLIDLFSKFLSPPQKTIQGLWAELFVIEQSNNPEYLIQSWHISSFDKYDFNDGEDKLEVKSTKKIKRVHSFSIEQLHPNKNSKLLIASVLTIPTGVGCNIFDLIDRIERKVKNQVAIARINEVLAETLGNNLEKSFYLFFDYQFAVDNLAYFDSNDIPNIDIRTISSNISNVRFDCDLRIIEPLKTNTIKSALFESLF